MFTLAQISGPLDLGAAATTLLDQVSEAAQWGIPIMLSMFGIMLVRRSFSVVATGQTNGAAAPKYAKAADNPAIQALYPEPTDIGEYKNPDYAAQGSPSHPFMVSPGVYTTEENMRYRDSTEDAYADGFEGRPFNPVASSGGADEDELRMHYEEGLHDREFDRGYRGSKYE